MLNLSTKTQNLECPMHKKQIKYLNIGKDCPLEQRIGCSSCMGGNCIDFELAEELLEKLLNSNNDNDQKEQLKIDYMHNIEQFRNQVSKLLNQMEKLIILINAGSDSLEQWLNQLKQTQNLNANELRKLAERLSKHLTKDNQLIQPKINDEWQLNLNKQACLLQKVSMILNQNFLQSKLQQAKQQDETEIQTPTQQIDQGNQIQKYIEEIDELKKKVEYYEVQIEKSHYQYTKMKEQLEKKYVQDQDKLNQESIKPKELIQIKQPYVNQENQIKVSIRVNGDGNKRFQALNEKPENYPLWKDFIKEIDQINNQLHWLKIKFAECLQNGNQQKKDKELYFSKKQQQIDDQFSQFYLNQQIAQLQTINKLLLDSQTMYKIDNIQVSNFYKDELELKKKVQETIDYIRNHKQHHDVCDIELKFIQELLSLAQFSKCFVVNSKDLQKYFQRLTDKNKFGIFYINNNQLLKNSKSLQAITAQKINDVQFKEGLQQDRDYTLINKYAWKFIQTLYFSSGPEIQIIDLLDQQK